MEKNPSAMERNPARLEHVEDQFTSADRTFWMVLLLAFFIFPS